MTEPKSRGSAEMVAADRGEDFLPHYLEVGRNRGWGLLLVDRIADRWAVAPVPTGTRVWFEIRYDE